MGYYQLARMMLPDSLMTKYQIVLGSLLFAACSSSSLLATNGPNASGGRGAGTAGVLGVGGSGTGGVLGTNGGGTGGVLGAAGSGAGGCDMGACRNGQVGLVPCTSNYVEYVYCDEAKSGVRCVNLPGLCPVLDAGVTDTREPDPSPDGIPDLPPDLPPDVGSDRLVSPDSSCMSGQALQCTCDNGLQGARICLPSLVFSECGCGTDALVRVKNGVIGTWTGTVTTPWTSPYRVTFVFDTYSHYSARTLDGSGYPALYYGIDDADSPEKLYTISDMQANGDASGTISIVYDLGYADLERLEGIALSADLNHLKFYFMHAGTEGPIAYDLQRV